MLACLCVTCGFVVGDEHRFTWGPAGSYPTPVIVNAIVLTGSIRVIATNLYDPADPTTLPNPNNTNTNCLMRMNRAGAMTLDAMSPSCFSNNVRWCSRGDLGVRGRLVDELWMAMVWFVVAVCSVRRG